MNVEIFACSGGLAEGFRRAGLHFDLVVDRDPDACASYEQNLGERPVQMDVHDLLRLVRAGWRPHRTTKRGTIVHDDDPVIDLLVADPPCTPWSRAGKRKGLDDERDMLEETVELIRLLRPRRYLLGNIPGLQDAPAWPVVQRVIGGLARDGYCVVDFAVLDAADYGVPQRRLRPWWFGHLDGPCLRWPAPTHGDPAKVGHALPGLQVLPWVTCREALAHLSPEDLGRPVRMKIRPNRNKSAEGGQIGSDLTRCSAPDRPAATVVSHASSKGGQIVIPANHNRLDEPSQTMGAKVRNVGPQVLAPLDWPWDRHSTTVYSEDRIMGPGHHDGSNLSAPNAIVLSERAAAILQGFPDGWHFAGATKRARWSQIGQAVPPAVAEAIGRAILVQMEASEPSAAGGAA